MSGQRLSNRLILLLALVLALLAAGCGARADADAADRASFEVAGALYAAGNYGEAAALYEQLVAQGYADAPLFYNLGNAYYRSGDWGRSILNYRRALLLAPRNADARANLLRARAQTVDRLAADQSDLLTTLAQLGDRLTLNELAIVSLGLWAIWALGWSLYRRPTRLIGTERRQTALQSLLVAAGLLLLVLLVLLGSRLAQQQLRPAAVVIAAETSARNEPRPDAAEAFALHSGAEISLLRQRGRWVEVALPGNSLTGWLPVADVAAIQAGVEQER